MKRSDRIRIPDFCCMACRKKHHHNHVTKKRARKCKECGKKFIPRQYQITTGQGFYCSAECWHPNLVASSHTETANKNRVASWKANGNSERAMSIRGPLHPCFTGKKILDGYKWIWIDGSYIAEHRHVVQNHFGRKLRSDEIVHHINHDRLDNRIENLQVLSRAQHFKEHPEISIARKLVPKVKGSKLTISDVKAIKNSLKNGASKSEISMQYGITETMVSYIKNGKSWANA